MKIVAHLDFVLCRFFENVSTLAEIKVIMYKYFFILALCGEYA